MEKMNADFTQTVEPRAALRLVARHDSRAAAHYFDRFPNTE
jgi:hypothetical protein